MNEKFIVFLDIDGTIVNVNPAPSERVISTIKKAQRKGHKIVLNTGRSRGFMEEKLLCAVKPDGIICAMGQYIEIDGKIIVCECLSEEHIKAAEKYSETTGKGGYFEGVNGIYKIGKVKPVMPWPDRADDCAVPLTEKDRGSILKFSFMTTLEDEYKCIFDVGLNVIQHPSYFETSLSGFSKSGGMEKVKEYFGINKTIAIGDSKNDLDMLLHADISVAMGNGDDVVKANAHYITDTLINDGAALAMEKFLEL